MPVGETQRKIRALFVFRRGRDRLLAEGRHRKLPDESLYGMNHINSKHFAVSFIERDDEHLALLDWLWHPFERLISWRLRMGFSLSTIVRRWQELRQADIIISVVDALGLPILMCKWVGVLPTPIIYMSQGLSDRLSRAPLFRAAYRRFMAEADVVVTLGEGAAAAVHQELAIPIEKIVVFPFGVDETFWQPASMPRERFILAVGSDAGRDYATLCGAVADETLLIVTRLPVPEAAGRANITVRSDFSEEELRSLYQRTAFVVTPLRDIAQPSGQTATLQAMACGAAVIITHTKGLWEPEVMKDGENCVLVPPGDVDALRSALQKLLHDDGSVQRLGQIARRTVESRYTTRHMADQLEALILRARQPANHEQR